jgi:uncharacterized lipoprotein YddW (UPF0748 family)
MKKEKKLTAFILLAFICIFQSLNCTGEWSPVRGVWIWGQTFTSSNIQSIINKLNENSVNEIYLLVKGTGGTKTDATKLTNIISSAHAKSIKVHLWYIVFQDDVYVNTNPDAHVYHCPKPDVDVRPYRMSTSAVNPFYPGYKKYVLNNIGYFLNNFDCDGIHLDNIRYDHLVYSFDIYSLQKAASLGCDTTRLLGFFNTTPGYTANVQNNGFINAYSNNDADVVTWVNMRKNAVAEYISAIRDTIEKVKPGIKLTAAYMPEGAYNSNISDVHYGQNYAQHSTLLDMISPMAYFKSYGQKTSWLKSVTQSAINRVDPKCKISAGVQAFDGVTATELEEQISYSMEGGSHGVLIFRYGTITTDSWDVVKSKFEELSITSVTTTDDILSLRQNYPNPFHSTTEIPLQITEHCTVSLHVYDVQGKLIRELINNKMNPGDYKIVFDGSNLSAGVYFYRLNIGRKSSDYKMILKN